LNPVYTLTTYSILISLSSICLGPSNGHYYSDLPIELLYEFVVSLTRVECPILIILPRFISLINLKKSTNYEDPRYVIFYPRVTCSHLGSNSPHKKYYPFLGVKFPDNTIMQVFYYLHLVADYPSLLHISSVTSLLLLPSSDLILPLLLLLLLLLLLHFLSFLS